MSSPLANWNGVQMPLEDVRVSVMDRAFLFGDAIYEVLRIYGGRPFLLSEHLERLRRSLLKIRIHCDSDRLEQRFRQTLTSSGVQEGLVYIQVTRGVAPRMHRFPAGDTQPNELIYVQELAEDPYRAVRQGGAAAITVPDDRWKRCDIKSVNLLANCLAAQAAADAGCHEALLVDADGQVVEGSHTSVFGVKDGCLWTTPLGPQILPGITRGLVLRLTERAQVLVVERSLMKSELSQIDELFLTGTTSEVLPVTSVDGQPVGDGQPGPITLRLAEAYGGIVRSLAAAPLE